MFFRQILHEDLSCASYVIGCPTYGTCVVIDPQGDPQEYVRRMESAGLTEMTAVIDTHLHADHLSCGRSLATMTGAPYGLGARASPRFKFLPLEDGEVIRSGNRVIQVLHTPGHTQEHISLVVDEWFVMTGDTLFVGDVGRVDLALENLSREELRSRADPLHRSLHRLLQLPDDLEVYPGHYSGSVCGRGMDGKPVSTIGRERTKNRPLALSGDEFATFQTEFLPPLPQHFHDIKRKNLGIL
jgi:glyoxylase-like metal-dependent hydrolase (beta-lactamase superfamily II)